MLQFLSFLKSWKQEKKQPQRNPKKEVTQLVLETRSRKPGQWKACRRRLGRGKHALIPVTASCPKCGVTASVQVVCSSHCPWSMLVCLFLLTIPGVSKHWVSSLGGSSNEERFLGLPYIISWAASFSSIRLPSRTYVSRVCLWVFLSVWFVPGHCFPLCFEVSHTFVSQLPYS